VPGEFKSEWHQTVGTKPTMSDRPSEKESDDVVTELRRVLANTGYTTVKCPACGWVERPAFGGAPHECARCRTRGQHMAAATLAKPAPTPEEPPLRRCEGGCGETSRRGEMSLGRWHCSHCAMLAERTFCRMNYYAGIA